MIEFHAFFAPQIQYRQVAAAVEHVLVGVPQQLVAMADEGAQGFAVGLAGEVHDDVLEVLAQRAEQHVQLGGAGVFQRFILGGIGEDPQPGFATGEGAVDQGGVKTTQAAQGIAEMKRALQAQQGQAVSRGRPRSSSSVC